MKDIKEDKNIVELFRDKTEEADLNQYLKSTFGGYTKKSVLEYLNLLRKQQQTSKDTFSRNLQALFEEKENIRKNNETLLSRLNKTAAEYDNLAESMKSIKLDDSDFSAQDIFSLKSSIASLEEEVKKSHGENKSLERKIHQLNNEMEDLTSRLEQSKQETEAQKEMFRAERLETKKQREMNSDLSRSLEEERDANKYLNGVMSTGKVAQLTLKVNELTEQLITQTDIIEKQNSENILKDETIDTLTNEIAVLKQRNSALYKSVEELNLQNDKLMLTNETLTNHLEEEYKKSIALLNDKSSITIDRLIVQKKLSDAESQITMLELELKKSIKSEDIRIQNNNYEEALVGDAD